jgi:predicted short-subunit dehydrogenase-like oxidoreductase (DUF2520 family)
MTTRPRPVSAGRTGTGRYSIDSGTTTVRFAVLGAGRLGASLALALRARGASLLGFSAHSPEGRSRAETWLGGRAVAGIGDLVALAPDVYLVAVPDRSLPAVAAELGAQLDGTDAPVIAHTSGATSVAVLDPCLQAGAATLVFHPLQTFSDPLTGWKRLAGAAIALTPSCLDKDSRATRTGFALADLLGARPFLLPDDKRGLYHAAATFACNYLVTLEHHAEELFVQAGLPATEALSLFLPLVKATLQNVENQGTVKALTGPLSRGDTKTIAGHLAALAADAPHLLPVYRALGLATLDLVRAQAEVGATVLAELRSFLQSPVPSSERPRDGTGGARPETEEYD